MEYSLQSNSGYLLVLINDGFADTLHRGCEKDSGLLASLVLGVNERNVPKSEEPQNVPQVRFLKIESFRHSALLIGAPARSDYDDFLSGEDRKSTRLNSSHSS